MLVKSSFKKSKPNDILQALVQNEISRDLKTTKSRKKNKSKRKRTNNNNL
jgi:hypothetical protein